MATRAVMNQKVAVSVVFVAAMFMNVMDITIVNVAIPKIGSDLHVAQASVSAVSIGYLVSLAVVIPASGWLGDRFGAKRILLLAIVIFTGASALCGFATDFDQLVGFRVLQGIGGGMLTPVGLAMLYRVFPPEERVRAASILIIPMAFAPALGPVVGGLLVTELSWRWVFFVNLPIGAIAFIFGALFVTEQKATTSSRFDIVGFLLAGTGFASLMYGVSESPERGWGDGLILSALTLGVVLIAVLIVTQLRTEAPLLGLRLYRDRLFRSGNAIVFITMTALLGTLYLASLFYQDGLGMSPLESGLSTFPEAIGVMVGSQSASRFFYRRFGPRATMTGGFVGITTFVALMSLVDSRDELWWMRVLMFLLGISLAHVFLPAQAATFARIAPADTGSASTLFNALRQLGGAVGVAAASSSIAAIGVTHVVGGRVRPDLTGYHLTFLVTAGIAALGALIVQTVRDEDAASTRAGHARPEAEPEIDTTPVPAVG